jgi:hypothetical protein
MEVVLEMRKGLVAVQGMEAGPEMETEAGAGLGTEVVPEMEMEAGRT